MEDSQIVSLIKQATWEIDYHKRKLAEAEVKLESYELMSKVIEGTHDE